MCNLKNFHKHELTFLTVPHRKIEARTLLINRSEDLNINILNINKKVLISDINK